MVMLNLWIFLLFTVRLSLSDGFPYNLSITNDGPVLFDTPISIRLELIPNSGEIKKSPKYFFNWIDRKSYFDCPIRFSSNNSQALSSTYNVTYHYRWLRCPPTRDNIRDVGVEVYDNPDFDWDEPLARISTTFKMVESIVGNLTARVITDAFNLQKISQEFLTNQPVAFGCALHDPSGVLAKGNSSFIWTITDTPTFPLTNLGPFIIHTFKKPGEYDVLTDVSVFIQRPPYPDSPKGVVEKTGTISTRVTIIDPVSNLQIHPHNNTIKTNDWFVLNVSALGSFPLTINWTVEYIGYSVLEPRLLFSGRTNFTCLSPFYPPSLESGSCVAFIRQNFSDIGAYRMKIVAQNKMSQVGTDTYFWVYSTERHFDFVETLMFPLVFVVFAIGLLILGYVQYLKRRSWFNRSLEVADFEVEYSNSSPPFSPRTFFVEAWNDYVGWIQSIVDPPNASKRRYDEIEGRTFTLSGETREVTRFDRQSYIHLQSKEHLGFSENSLDSDEIINGVSEAEITVVSYQNYKSADLPVT